MEKYEFLETTDVKNLWKNYALRPLLKLAVFLRCQLNPILNPSDTLNAKNALFKVSNVNDHFLNSEMMLNDKNDTFEYFLVFLLEPYTLQHLKLKINTLNSKFPLYEKWPKYQFI